MNLVIDAGNTAIKTALFKEGKLVEAHIFKNEEAVRYIQGLVDGSAKINKALISSVGDFNSSQIERILEHTSVISLDRTFNFPFNNKYETPGTLGLDRLALVTAASVKYPRMNVLIIDAGTCITYDFINSQNEYLGGAISPGMRLRYRSLNTLTANLPLLETKMPLDLIGVSTQESIHSGVVNGIVYEIEGVISSYRIKYPDLTVILTGGDCLFLSNRLKNGIFANSNFLLEGLNFILQHNKI